MAGHNKWSKIKRKTAKNDAKKGREFTKIIREITVAAREGGGDPDYNPRLRLAIDKADEAEMPSENVERAIKKGTGELEGVNYEEVSYEGYGPNGVALFIECLTDNTNRSVADVRHVLGKYDGSLGQSGSVAWQFERKGQIVVDAGRYTEDAVFEAAIVAGAQDVQREDDEFVILSELADLHEVRKGVEEAGIETESAELTRIPKNEIAVAGKQAETLLKLLESLEDLDDVQKVHTNADIDDAVVAEAL
mgnify:CR=1 FL=1